MNTIVAKILKGTVAEAQTDTFNIVALFCSAALLASLYMAHPWLRRQ
jgi:hypothetical protein